MPRSQTDLLWSVLDREGSMSAHDLIERAITQDDPSDSAFGTCSDKQKRISLKRSLFHQRNGRDGHLGRPVIDVTCPGDEAFSYADARARLRVPLSGCLFEALERFKRRMRRVRPEIEEPWSRAAWEQDVRAHLVGEDGITACGLRGVVPCQRALFAARELPSHHVLGAFFGVVIRTGDYERKRAQQRASDSSTEYAVAVTDFLQLDPTFDDGSLIEHPSRSSWNPLPLMNEDPAQSPAQNVRMVYDDLSRETDCVLFVTTRPVPAGQELLTYYGPSYPREAYFTR